MESTPTFIFEYVCGRRVNDWDIGNTNKNYQYVGMVIRKRYMVGCVIQTEYLNGTTMYDIFNY